MASRGEQWLHDHKDYPHDYCLIWPFARESRVGRGTFGVGGKSKWAHRVMWQFALARWRFRVGRSAQSRAACSA